MRYPEYVCPVHVHQRFLCGTLCADRRLELTKLGRDYRQYWYDRRRGISARRAAPNSRPRGWRQNRNRPLWLEVAA